LLVNQTSPPKDVEPKHFFAPCLFPPACQGAANAEEFEDKYSEPILNTTTGITVIVRSLFVRGCFWWFLVVGGCLVLSIKIIVHSLLCVLVFWLFVFVRDCLVVSSRTLSHASLTNIVFFCILLCFLSSGRSLPPHTQRRVRSTGVRPEQTVVWDVPTQLHHRRGQRHGVHAMPHHRREHCSLHARGVFGGVVGDCSSRHAHSIPWVRETCLYYTCWWYSLCNFQYRPHYENTCSYNVDC
jgi:hypothetical protein